MERLLKNILEYVRKHPMEYSACEDLLGMSQEAMKADIALGIKYLKELSAICEKIVPKCEDAAQMREFYELHRETLKAAAEWDFDSYLLFVEWERDPEKKFYAPRREKLKVVVDALQDLIDDKLDILAISLPPGVGKTTLAIFFLTWLAGKIPDKPILTGSHSNAFVRGTYDECLRIFDPNGEYLWNEVFPNVKVVSTNAKDFRIDLGTEKRFETLEFTSIGTGNAGLYRAATLLYCDDLVSGLEVALSKDRLDKLWNTYTTDLRQRKIGKVCKELHIATRWSVHDVIGRLEREYASNPRARFIVIPAMDDNDESNFDYRYGVGFATDFYREQRAIREDVNWRALYMNQPIEREGLLYSPDELRRYFDLPDREPDAILGICDTKDRGADYAFLPVAYQYGRNFYIDDCVCDNGSPDIVDQRLVDILLRHKVHMCRFESNSAGGRVAKTVQDKVKEKGGRCEITTKFSTANKETRIIMDSPFVKENFLFRDNSVIRSKDYQRMMKMLCEYTMAGKNKHDDVPDGLSMMANFIQSLETGKVEVFKRPW